MSASLRHALFPLLACAWLALPAWGQAPAAGPDVLAPPAAQLDAGTPVPQASAAPPEELAENEAAAEPESLGWTLLRTLVVLGIVVGAIYLTLNVGLRRLMGLKGVVAGRASVVSVLERIPLDQRRTLFVLEAAGEYLLVGGGDAGLQLISKLDAAEVARIRASSPPSGTPLSPFLQKLLSRGSGSPPPSA